MRGVGSVAAGGVAAQGGRGGGRTGFAVAGTGAGQATGRTAPAGAVVAPLALGVLALQERGGDAAERDAAARRRAGSLLDELRALQAELLSGRAEPGRLARLAALEADGEEGTDPALREVVQAVVLRARVEMARRGWDAPAAGTVATSR